MSERNGMVIIIDGDASFRRSAERLIRSAGHTVQTLASAVELLNGKRPNSPTCLVVDVTMPGLSGLDLQKEFAKAGIQTPVIFVTGHGDIPMAVQAMKAGAIDFLEKPFREQDLLDAIDLALRRDGATHELQTSNQSLTRREREVMRLVVAGKLNKQIAAELKVAEKTIKFHRSHIMRKMRAESLAELVRMAAQLENSPEPSTGYCRWPNVQ